MTDTERLDFLEDILWNNQKIGRGVAFIPSFCRDRTPRMTFQALGIENGLNLGRVLSDSTSLRQAIDDTKNLL
jgi:hypothetical protein